MDRDNKHTDDTNDQNNTDNDSQIGEPFCIYIMIPIIKTVYNNDGTSQLYSSIDGYIF